MKYKYIPVCVVAGIIAIFFKTHLVFGGDYFSKRNVLITLIIFSVISLLLCFCVFIDKRKEKKSSVGMTKDMKTIFLFIVGVFLVAVMAAKLIPLMVQ